MQKSLPGYDEYLQIFNVSRNLPRWLPPVMNKSWGRHWESKGYRKTTCETSKGRKRSFNELKKKRKRKKGKGTKEERPRDKIYPSVPLYRDSRTMKNLAYIVDRYCSRRAKGGGWKKKGKKEKIVRLIPGNNGLIDLDEDNLCCERTSKRWRRNGWAKRSVKRFQPDPDKSSCTLF